MKRNGEKVHVDEVEASGGSKEGVVRWVLIAGTLLAIILLSITWMTGAAFQGDVEEEANVSEKIDSAEGGNSTDSIVGEDATEIEGAAEPGGAQSEGLDTIEN